jgi:hypothetical protein
VWVETGGTARPQSIQIPQTDLVTEATEHKQEFTEKDSGAAWGDNACWSIEVERLVLKALVLQPYSASALPIRQAQGPEPVEGGNALLF